MNCVAIINAGQYNTLERLHRAFKAKAQHTGPNIGPNELYGLYSLRTKRSQVHLPWIS